MAAQPQNTVAQIAMKNEVWAATASRRKETRKEWAIMLLLWLMPPSGSWSENKDDC
jgi:hypothetical protein